jgi:glucose-6-phosphate dehydrogenase assembly protein OpcA
VEEAVTPAGSGAVSEAVSRIEAELNAFWSAANQGDQPKARASTMNFVVLGGAAETDHLRDEIETLAQTRAGRAFLMRIDGHLAPWEVASDVSAVCHKEGDNVVCYDRIELGFGAIAAGRAASVLGALVLPEVPTMIEVGLGAPTALLDALVGSADRLIVDTANLGVRKVAEIARKTKAPIADRAFVRTFSWRDLIARFFDDVAFATKAVTRIRVTRTSGGKHEPAAILLGWLLSRLGMRLETKETAVNGNGDKVAIELVAEEPKDPLGPGEITAVHITTWIDGVALELSCARLAEDAHAACWKREGARTDAHHHALGFRDESWVVLKCIDATEGDGVYREAVLAAADWSGR